MKKASHLLLRSPLLPGESLPSYLVRLARLNGYHTPTMVIQVCQERLSRPDIITGPTRAETYARLAELVKLDVDRLYATSAHSLAITLLPAGSEPDYISLRSGVVVGLLPAAVLRRHLWPETNAQFCPRCLADAGYHRLAWLPQAAAICLRHRCLLIKGCPRCGSKLRITDVVAGCCGQCGFELRTSPIISLAADEFGLFSQHLIQSWLRVVSPSKVRRGGLPDQPDFILYQVAYALHRAIRTIQRQWDYLHDPFDVDTAVSVFPCKTTTQMTPFKAYVLYATAVKALLKWPHGFYDFLNAFTLRDHTEPTGSVVDDLGAIYTGCLRNGWKQPEFSFLQATFDRYLRENFAFSLALQQKYRGSANYVEGIGSDYLSYREAAKRLDASVVIVERAVELGLLRSKPQSGQKGSLPEFKRVGREAVSGLKHRWRYGIPLYDTARLLGVSQKVTRAMMMARLITPVSGPGLDGYRRWKIGPHSLAYFFTRLGRSEVRYRYQQPVKLVSLDAATETVAKAGLDMVFLIEGVLAGHLRGYWPPGNRHLGQLMISAEDLAVLLQAIDQTQSANQPPIEEKTDGEVAPASTGVDSKNSKVQLSGPQLAWQALSVGQHDLSGQIGLISRPGGQAGGSVYRRTEKCGRCRTHPGLFQERDPVRDPGQAGPARGRRR